MGSQVLDLALLAMILASTLWAPTMAGLGMAHPLRTGPGTGHPAPTTDPAHTQAPTTTVRSATMAQTRIGALTTMGATTTAQAVAQALVGPTMAGMEAAPGPTAAGTALQAPQGCTC